MKRNILIALLAVLTLTGWAKDAKNKAVVSQTKNSITFVVDKGLKPIDDKSLRYQIKDGEKIAHYWVSEEKIPEDYHNIVAISFAEEKSLRSFRGKDEFFKSIKYAYENHKALVLSPDMVWLAISQGFARYVNAHSEEMRHQLVNHEGKMDLVIRSDRDLLKDEVNWPQLVGDFAAEIAKYTKEDIAQTLTADFTTTTPAERVASQITLMESVKTYFQYRVMYASCGIPRITLRGTPEDWQKVLEKTRKLGIGGLEEWTKSLEPILTEFIRTAEGEPDRTFWKDIVKRQPVDELEGGGCSNKKPTKLDGWFLKLFPNEDGKTPDEIYHTQDMPAEYVRVGFKYDEIDSELGTVKNEVDMELWAGFVGAIEDTLTNTIIPKIGWLVRRAESDTDVYNRLSAANEKGVIDLRVQQVPKALSWLEHIKKLCLQFTDKVDLPEWMDKIIIDKLVIVGEIQEEEKEAIRKRFPNVEFSKW